MANLKRLQYLQNASNELVSISPSTAAFLSTRALSLYCTAAAVPSKASLSTVSSRFNKDKWRKHDDDDPGPALQRTTCRACGLPQVVGRTVDHVIETAESGYSPQKSAGSVRRPSKRRKLQWRLNTQEHSRQMLESPKPAGINFKTNPTSVILKCKLCNHHTRMPAKATEPSEVFPVASPGPTGSYRVEPTTFTPDEITMSSNTEGGKATTQRNQASKRRQAARRRGAYGLAGLVAQRNKDQEQEAASEKPLGLDLFDFLKK